MRGRDREESGRREEGESEFIINRSQEKRGMGVGVRVFACVQRGCLPQVLGPSR